MEKSAAFQLLIPGCATSTGHGMALPEYGQPTLFGRTTQKLTQKSCDTFFKHGKSQSESFGLGESTSLLH
jgi:hypothetical protein